MPRYELKALSQINEPDKLHRNIVVLEDGGPREMTLADYHTWIDDIKLLSEPPEDIQQHFETARNLFLYSWFVYRFTPVAEAHAYSSVEYAIREKAKANGLDAPKGFRKLINLAVSQRWITDRGFRSFQDRDALGREQRLEESCDPSPTLDDQEYCRVLLETLPHLRNELAHGSFYVNFPGSALRSLEICADIINQLFMPR